MSSLRVPWQNDPHKTNTHTTCSTKHAEDHDAPDIQNNLYLRVCVFGLFYFLFIVSLTISPRNVELPHWYNQWLSLGV